MSDTATPGSAMAATGLFTKTDTRMLMGQVLLAIAAFGIGSFQGLAQALDRVMPADATIWTMYPGLQNYYQGLTSHAVQLHDIAPQDVLGGLVIYCAGCQANVLDRMDGVIEGLQQGFSEQPFLGVFTYGEQGCFLGGESRHGNLMISVLVFSERARHG